MRFRFPLAVVALVVPALLTPASLVAQQSTPVVTVNCAEGESINRALTRRPNAASLIVEISGMCTENVVVTRDRVTLRGSSPGEDGITGIANTHDTDAVIWVRGAHLVTIENLRLAGGGAGVLATDASTPLLRLINLTIDGNTRYAVELEESVAHADSLVATGNGWGIGAFHGSQFTCTNCQLADPQRPMQALGRANVIALTASTVAFTQSTISAGGWLIDNSAVQLVDGTLSAFPANPAIVGAKAEATLIRVTLDGQISADRGSNVVFTGVTQPVASQPNAVGNDSFLSVNDGPGMPSSIRDVTVRQFSNLTMGGTSQIDGNLVCSQGANAFCPNAAANVTGTANCALCQKP